MTFSFLSGSDPTWRDEITSLDKRNSPLKKRVNSVVSNMIIALSFASIGINNSEYSRNLVYSSIDPSQILINNGNTPADSFLSPNSDVEISSKISTNEAESLVATDLWGLISRMKEGTLQSPSSSVFELLRAVESNSSDGEPSKNWVSRVSNLASQISD